MVELLEVCKKGRMNGRDAENPYMRSSDAARAWTVGTLMDGVPTGCRSGRGHSLVVNVGSLQYKADFKDSEKQPVITRT